VTELRRILTISKLLAQNQRDKAVLVCLSITPTFLMFLSWYWGLRTLTEFGQEFADPNFGWVFTTFSLTATAGWTVLLGWGLWLQRRQLNPDIYPLTVVTYYGIAMVPLGYMIGLADALVGAVLLAVLLTGYIVFQVRHVHVAGAVAGALLAIFGTLTAMDVLPYAPVFLKPPSAEAVWMVSEVLLVMPIGLTVFGLTIGVVKQLEGRTEEAIHLSLTDPLTGAANRRAIMDFANRELASLRSSSRPMTVILMDLDHFKMINDSFGHDVGDEVLKATSDSLQTMLRETDMVGRYGGEEFLLVLPQTDEAMAVQVVERIQAALRGLSQRYSKFRDLKISASYGICSVTKPMDENRVTADEILKCADVSLYKAKAAGRDGYHVWRNGTCTEPEKYI